ncbi:MAG: glycosyltransferase family 61 protein [Rhizomicrobium sp.]
MHHENPEVVEVPGGIVPMPEAPEKAIGVFDRDIRLVEGSLDADRHLVRGHWNPDAAALRTLRHDRRTAYYLGVSEGQYGHFLLETLSRAWAWNSEAHDLLPVIQPGVPAFARGLYDLIPGLLERIAPLQQSVQFGRVIVSRAAFVIGRRAHLAFKTMCMQMAERAIGTRRRVTEQPLYISRTHLNPASRHGLLGEVRLERFLESQGFAIAHPQELPIAEQIALFNGHKWIVAPMGSACHTRLFALGATNLVMLAGPGFLRNFVLCDALSEGTTHYLNVLSIPDLGVGFGQNFWEPFMLDEGRLLATLKDLGLVNPGATLDGPAPSLDEYKIKWMEIARRQAARKPELADKLLRAANALGASMGEARAGAERDPS